MTTMLINTHIGGLLSTGQVVTSVVLIEVARPAYTDCIMGKIAEEFKEKRRSLGYRIQRAWAHPMVVDEIYRFIATSKDSSSRRVSLPLAAKRKTPRAGYAGSL